MKKIEINPSMVFANEKQENAFKIFDGNPRTKWIGGQCPGYVEIRFDTVHKIEKIIFECSKKSYSIFSIFVSNDYVNFTEAISQNDEIRRTGRYEFTCDLTCCALRFFIKYDSTTVHALIRNIELFGEDLQSKAERAPEELAQSFFESEYSKELTEKDTTDELHALVCRTIGKSFSDSFIFMLQKSDEEFYSLTDENGKIKITANSGVNLAAGLGHYYKYFCSLHFSQVGRNAAMPSPMPKIGGEVTMHTTFKVRYSYNYCALSYTMAFWGEEEWQKELDLLALQGVNVILDITALEEVWRRFLSKLGYSNDEARAFITGPAYYAWFNMANIYSTGGPVPLAFFKSRTELARRNHLFMRKMGMMPVLQGYSGMVPNDVRKYVPDASIILQGLWNGLDRPAMLRTNSDAYIRLAKLFYDCQKEVFGDITTYFATDPFHEGGKSGAMNIENVSRQIMDSLLESYPKAIWIIQSWGENPSKALMKGIAHRKEHALVLDLYAEKKPRWESFLGNEFMDTPWVYCMLNNFGGRMGLHGHLRTIANEISRASKKAHCMKGIGVTPEATFSNPIIFDLFFETIWTDKDEIEPVDLNEWLKGYARRRYGECTDSIYEAMLMLNKTVYNPDLNEHGEGAPESVINARPTLYPTSPSTWGNGVVAYDKRDFEKAVKLFTRDIDKFKNSEGYRFDLIDFLKQVLSNTAQEYQRCLARAYKERDVIAFMKWSDKFMSLISYTDEILSGEKVFTLGNWISKAKALAKDYDDFSKKLFEFNARALITTWAGSKQGAEKGGLRDYSNKQWAGLTKDFYQKRWSIWTTDCINKLNGKKVSDPDWFRIENRWTWQTNEYTDIPTDLDLKKATEKVLSVYSVDSAEYE